MIKRKKHIKKLSDDELIDLYKQTANKECFAVVYTRYYPLVLGVCLKYLKNLEDSEDATTIIFEKLMEDLKSVEVKNLNGWLYVVVKNYCLQSLRKKKFKTVEFESMAHQLFDEDELLEKENKEQMLNLLTEKLTELKPNQNQCLTLFYLHKKSYEDITKLTNFSMKEVKSYLQNGKRKLQLLMEKDYQSIKTKIVE